jgi:hypothetical protein
LFLAKAGKSEVAGNEYFDQAKHETNAGGACSIRDAQGVREQENIAILSAAQH